MGNLASCCARPCPKEAVLFDPNGKLWQLPAPVKAAEVMLELPEHIVALVNEIWRSQRIVALHADDELVPGKMYMAVLESRKNCKVDEAELAAIESTLQRKRIVTSKRSERKNKGGTLHATTPVEEKNSDGAGGVVKPQMSSYSRRQWNPVLEPILEDD